MRYGKGGEIKAVDELDLEVYEGETLVRLIASALIHDPTILFLDEPTSMLDSARETLHVVAWVSLLSHNQGLMKWFLMQCIKESSTLRVSPKRDKPSPRIVCRYGKQNGEIQNYLRYRRRIKNWKDERLQRSKNGA